MFIVLSLGVYKCIKVVDYHSYHKQIISLIYEFELHHYSYDGGDTFGQSFGY